MNKKTLLTILQIAVTLGLLWWVFHDPEKRAEMAQALGRADWHWVVAGVAVFFASSLLATVRWKVLLAVQDIKMSWVRTWKAGWVPMN